ncbi:MAG: DUF3293 domain-containing protein [Proteobacteria bacterium]|nr:DUF3293 domain-containing protein [Pseudomonadota bacterium]
MPVPSDLIAAYRAAIYEIDVDGEPLAFQVDEQNSALDGYLVKRGAATGVFVTAYNPHSEVQAEEKNAVAHGALLEAVRRAGKEYVLARGRDADDSGPTEAGLFVFDLPRDDALALARRFGQYAVVVVERGKAPALVFAE